MYLELLAGVVPALVGASDPAWAFPVPGEACPVLEGAFPVLVEASPVVPGEASVQVDHSPPGIPCWAAGIPLVAAAVAWERHLVLAVVDQMAYRTVVLWWWAGSGVAEIVVHFVGEVGVAVAYRVTGQVMLLACFACCTDSDFVGLTDNQWTIMVEVGSEIVTDTVLMGMLHVGAAAAAVLGTGPPCPLVSVEAVDTH